MTQSAVEVELDLIDFSDATGGFSFTLHASGGSSFSLAPGLGTDTYSSIEGVIGSAFVDTLTGNGSNNEIWGGAGNDALLGLDGNDALKGDAGADTLTGGLGDDRFVYSTTANSTVAISDSIADFGNGSDQIDLTGIDANAALSGNQDFAWGSTTATAKGVWYSYDAANNRTTIFADTDGNTTAEFRLVLNNYNPGTNPLDQNDFLGLTP